MIGKYVCSCVGRVSSVEDGKGKGKRKFKNAINLRRNRDKMFEKKLNVKTCLKCGVKSEKERKRNKWESKRKIYLKKIKVWEN